MSGSSPTDRLIPDDTPAPSAAHADAEPGSDGAAHQVRVGRRGFLTGAGVALGAALAGAAGYGVARATDGSHSSTPASRSHAFEGPHQAGISTSVQEHLHFVALDVTTTDRDELISLLTQWTAAARSMMAGGSAGQYGPMDGPYDAPPQDTGEAYDLDAANLTITFGFGPTLFETADGTDRFGLSAQRPEALKDLPHFPGDTLLPERTGGDIAIQACADDPQVAVHAIRNLVRIAFGKATVRWSQLGYGKTSMTTRDAKTPRNLFGFKDGTANILADDAAALNEHVWVSGTDTGANDGWLAGGSYLIARRIRMTIETWDRSAMREQENVIGRTKQTGAPLSGGDEFTEPDFTLAGREGKPLIDVYSHVAMAHPSNNAGARLLRRGYNYTDGSDDLGRLDAGLFFIAYVRDPWRQYVPMQNAMAKNDLLSEYIRHTGSGIWAVPAGITSWTDGAFIGQELFRA